MSNHAERAGAVARASRDWVLRHPLIAALLAAAVVSGLGVALIDRPLALSLQANLHPHTFGFFMTVTDLGLWIYWYGITIGAWVICATMAGLSLTMAAHETWRLRARSWLYVLSSLAASGLLVQGVKYTFGRMRPPELIEQQLYTFMPLSGATSFPSGHAQTIWAVMIGLWFIYPRYRAAYIVIALLVSVSRVATTMHFFSDVVMGSVLAIVVAIALKNWFERDGRPSVRLPGA